MTTYDEWVAFGSRIILHQGSQTPLRLCLFSSQGGGLASSGGHLVWAGRPWLLDFKRYKKRVPFFILLHARLVTQSCLTLCNPVDYSPPAPSVHGIPRQEYWSGLPFPPPGIFPTQGLNPGLLHFRRIPYCPSQQGSPFIPLASIYSSWLKPRVLLQPNLTFFFFF